MSTEYKPYWQLLKDPQWQKKRLEIMNRDEWICGICQNNAATLNVHHKQYIKGRKPWEYDDSNFITLCEDCHSRVTDVEKRIKNTLAFEPVLCVFEKCLDCISDPDWFDFLEIVYLCHANKDKLPEILSTLRKKYAAKIPKTRNHK